MHKQKFIKEDSEDFSKANVRMNKSFTKNYEKLLKNINSTTTWNFPKFSQTTKDIFKCVKQSYKILTDQ